MAARALKPKKLTTGQKVKAARDAAGLTQLQLAYKARVDIGTVSRLERDMGSSLDTIRKVVEAMGEDVREFVS